MTTTLTADPMKQESTPMNTLAAKLINEHEEKRGWGTRARIELTPEQADELRKGIIDGRCAWGITETIIGRVSWMVLQERCASREGHVLRYNLTDPPMPKERPREFIDAIASGYALNAVQSQEHTYLTETLTTCQDENGMTSSPTHVRLEAYSVTEQHQERTLKHWKKLNMRSKKKPPKRSTRTGTYTITATTITARLGTEVDPAQEPYAYRHYDGNYYLLDYTLEEVLCLETEEEQQLESLIEKREEWRKDYAVLLYEVVKNGKKERYQYQYVATEQDENGKRKRGGCTWVLVEQFHLQNSYDKARLVLD